MADPLRTLLLTHENGLTLSPNMAKVYKNTEQHDPLNLDRAREIAGLHDPIPVGILYQNPKVPCYEELRNAGQQRSTRYIKSGLEAEFDKFTIWPHGVEKARPSA
jgi:2-oxoglutarate ferredoxin oxidoreductase subunit beta